MVEVLVAFGKRRAQLVVGPAGGFGLGGGETRRGRGLGGGIDGLGAGGDLGGRGVGGPAAAAAAAASAALAPVAGPEAPAPWPRLVWVRRSFLSWGVVML